MSLRLTAAATGAVGAVLFLVGTALHPARSGPGVAAAGDLYGTTHAIQAIGLAALVTALASVAVPAGRRLAHNAALIGTIAWLALIVYDGAHNPVTARHAPELVHTPADLEPGGALLVIPALVLFPAGYALLAVALVRDGDRLPGLLLGAGALTYWCGGLLIFAAGPDLPLIQILEVSGVGMFAAGFVLLMRANPASMIRQPAQNASGRD